METSHLAPAYATAVYSEQRIPQYQGNPLIAALPPIGTEEEVMNRLFSLPYFAPEQRNWTDAERIQMIAQLASFMLPMSRHVQLAYALDAMMRQGYIGRVPHSVQSSAIFRKLYEQQTHGRTFPTTGEITAQLSSSLIGVSGMGKTTTIKRLFAGIPPVIHHPDFGIYQIPYLHIEMPFDGASLKGLAHSIFRKVDLLLPEANYSEQYAKGSHTGTETLMNQAARVIHMHSVGLLVVDETQNIENSPVNRKGLMTLLVSASNELGVPILFVGTSGARELLTDSFRQARRSSGFGVPTWESLTRGKDDKQGEWELFAQTLLKFQWLKKPVETTPFLIDLLYHHSQGIIDVAIKLVAVSQVRAIMDGSETITGQLVESVAKNELSMLAPMIDALRSGNLEALQRFRDIKPLSLTEILRQTELQYAGRKVAGVTAKAGGSDFNRMVSTALETLGFSSEQADELTERAADAGAANALEAVQVTLSTTTSGKRSRTSSGRKDKTAAGGTKVALLNLRPGDYRNAFDRPDGGTIFERLGTLGMLPDLEALFPA
ncbi:AAA family ATPase [Dechloromonas hortensis]|uniref:AAA family ATPase n=1 Tax=Dechloromonas hortensis TaxID=337779 RepID=UPI001291EA5B|nr:AAA family ATPase [Dechloromonas hortensis]